MADLPPAGDNVEKRRLPRLSADADILVRPAHLRRLETALNRYGWQRKTRLYSGGAVEHSVDWWHPELGSADVHIRFPGIQLSADLAFAEFWRERRSIHIAHRPCKVPSLDAQRLVLLLHAARNGGAQSPATLRAEVALAGATGHLDDYSDRPEYDLWRLLGLPDADVFDLWVAMVRAAPTTLARARAILYAVRIKAERVELGLERRATTIKVLRVQGSRLRRAGVGTLSVGVRWTTRLVARLRTRNHRASP